MIIARVVKPATPFKSSVFREEIEKAANEIARDVQTDFERTVVTWKHKPKFTPQIKTGAAGKGVVITIAPKPEKPYEYVDAGTRPHVIRAKTRRGLIFKTGGRPKTEPDVIQAFPGQPGTDWKNKQSVNHPGTDARNFTKHIAAKYKKELARVTKNALARAARRSGHATSK